MKEWPSSPFKETKLEQPKSPFIQELRTRALEDMRRLGVSEHWATREDEIEKLRDELLRLNPDAKLTLLNLTADLAWAANIVYHEGFLSKSETEDTMSALKTGKGRDNVTTLGLLLFLAERMQTQERDR